MNGEEEVEPGHRQSLPEGGGSREFRGEREEIRNRGVKIQSRLSESDFF